ncbi:MAG: DNA translocase FtsK [Acidobacteriota bacterium]
MSVYPKQKFGELLGIVFVAASALLLLALFSYNTLDPSLNVASPDRQAANYAGKVGAWVADLLLQLLGLPAFLLPLPLLFLGYKKIRSREIEYPWLKGFSFASFLLTLCAGFSLLLPALSESLNFTPGGVFGVLLSDWLLQYLNTLGSLVVLLTILIVSLLLTTRFSVEHSLAWAGGRNWNIFSGRDLNIGDWYSSWRRSRRSRKRKELPAQKEMKKTVLAEPPRTIAFEAPPAEAEVEPPTIARGPLPYGRGSEVFDSNQPGRDRTSKGYPAAPAFDVNPLPAGPYQTPPLDFLTLPGEESALDEQELMARAQKLSTKCAEFDVHGRVHQIHPGPVVTTFEFKPDPGVKYSKITNLDDDLCLALKAESVRIDRIPGKNTVGIEVPNLNRQVIYLREILSSAAYQQTASPLTLALGKLINGNTHVTDLARMPHLLIAGTTGAGKSVALNCLVCSILYKAGPSEVRFIMIDPKRLELGVYEGIPHLLTPIVTDPKQAANALNWAVRQMEDRYKLLAQYGVRNIDQFNKLVQTDPARFQEDEASALSYIVLIVDELADLMMTAGKEVEASLTRLAQMARAIGIHLILATQRPSVDVLTGLIKANFPCRISFRVSSKIDSRTILDANGAEQLLGSGDMLFLAPGTSRVIRVHGAFISEKEIARITDFLKQQASPEYRQEILEDQEEKESALVDMEDIEDDLYDEAARFVVETGKASTSLLQRRLRIGYGRAARLLDMMEHEGIIGPPDGSKAREVLVASNYFDEPGGS